MLLEVHGENINLNIVENILCCSSLILHIRLAVAAFQLENYYCKGTHNTFTYWVKVHGYVLPLQVNLDSGGCNVMMFYLPNFSARNAAGGGGNYGNDY